MAGRNTRRLLKRIQAELGIAVPDDVTIRRTYAGRWQRSAGSYSAVLCSGSDVLFELGLYMPVAELVRCPNLILSHEYGRVVDCGCSGRCLGRK